MKAVVYARVSTEEQTEDKFSIETQLQDIEHHCQRQGDEVVNCYVDIQSGADAIKDRANFELMLNEAKAGLFDKIVVWRPDRLFRGLSPAAKLAKVLDETGCKIEAVLQPLDRNMIGLWAWVAEQELETLRQRFRAGKRASAARLGKWTGGFLRYGYKHNRDTGKLEIEEEEAEVVRGLFEWVASGKSALSWCRWANDQGIPTKRRSKGWTPQHTTSMLRDRTYTGNGAYGKLTRRGNRLVKADDPVPMEYPPIISEELFNKVQMRSRQNMAKSKGSTKRFYLLHQLGRCGECGGSLGCQTVHAHRYLRCNRQASYPHLYHCYSPQNWNMNLVDDYLWNEVEDIIEGYRNATLDRLAAEYDSVEENMKATIARAKRELERCQLERQRLLTAIRKGYATEAEAELQFKAIMADEEQWEEELAAAEAIESNTEAVQEGILNIVGTVLTAFDFGFILTQEQKKEILNTVLDKFVLYRDGRVELRLKVPVNETQVTDSIITPLRNEILFNEVIKQLSS